MPLVPRQLRPRCRGASAARSWPAQRPGRQSLEKNFLAWKQRLLAKALSGGLLALACLVALSVSGVPLRDLVMVSGARDNQLVGYGLVAGLAGDGDKDQIYTKQTVANLLLRYGINIPATTLSEKRRGRHGHGGHPAVSQEWRAD